MGKHAGFLKTLKNGFSGALNYVGSKLQKLSDLNLIPAIANVIPGAGILGTLVGKPLNKVTQKVGTTLTKFSDAIDENITGSELFDYLNDEYKYSAFLTPYNVYKTLNETMIDGLKNGKNKFESLTDGLTTVIKDAWNYNMQAFK